MMPWMAQPMYLLFVISIATFKVGGTILIRCRLSAVGCRLSA